VGFKKDLARNRAAFHNYFIEDRFEAGIILVGTEVKSLREGACNLKDAYARIRDGEAFMHNCHISPYKHGNVFNHEPLRTRKLLLHKKELIRLERDQATTGQTLIPLRLYLKDGKVKVEIGTAKGKKQHDKREAKKRHELNREAEAALRDHANKRQRR
jgi:SsrA-binding protein